MCTRWSSGEATFAGVHSQERSSRCWSNISRSDAVRRQIEVEVVRGIEEDIRTHQRVGGGTEEHKEDVIADGPCGGGHGRGRVDVNINIMHMPYYDIVCEAQISQARVSPARMGTNTMGDVLDN